MRRAAFAIGLVVMLAAVPAALQERHPVSGRVIAPVMGVGGAGWLERPEREAEEEPSRAIEALDLRTGMTVADIGAGSGYYTVRMARKVGAEGRVYATDIQVQRESQECGAFAHADDPFKVSHGTGRVHARGAVIRL